jgi:hypothetical protein
MKRTWLLLFASTLVGAMLACSDDGPYYKNEVMMDHIAKRYGSPHKVEELEGNQTRWTYFKRSTGTVGYSGIAREEACQAFALTFDRHNILRDWQQVKC